MSSAENDDMQGGLSGRLYLLLPGAVRRRLDRSLELRRVLFNINWRFTQRIFDAVLGFFIGIAVLRYLGPTQFGLLSYISALVGLGVPFAMLGLNNVVVRNLVARTEASATILGTALGLRLSATTVAMACVLAGAALLRPGEPTILLFTLLIALGHLLGAPSILATWFRSRVEAKYIVLSRSGSRATFALLKVALILAGAPLALFVASIAGELVLTGILLTFFYARSAAPSLRSFSPRAPEARALLRESWPLTLSGFMATVYLRADQVMLGEMLHDHAVGIYAAAARLSGVLYLIPGVVAGSVFPSLVKARGRDRQLYRERFQLLYDGLFWLSAAAAGSISIIGPWLVPTLFGPEYMEAASVVSIHVWSAVFVFVGTASQQYLLAEQLTRITMFSTGLGAVINLGMNAVLIPQYGVKGAAFATLLSTSVSHFCAMAVFRASRPTLGFVLGALNPVGVARRWSALLNNSGDS